MPSGFPYTPHIIASIPANIHVQFRYTRPALDVGVRDVGISNVQVLTKVSGTRFAG